MSEVRQLPAVEERVETGPVKFGEDLAGLFIRGDDAFAFKLAIARVMLGGHDVMARAQLQALGEMLASVEIKGNLEAKLRGVTKR